MNPRRALLFAFLILVVSAAAFALLIFIRAQGRLRQIAIDSSTNHRQIQSLRAEYERLRSTTLDTLGANPVNSPRETDAASELLRLAEEERILKRRKAELLNSTNALRVPFSPSPSASFNLRSRSDYQSRTVVTQSTSQKYKDELLLLASTQAGSNGQSSPRRDAQNLGEAVRKFARTHDGLFPTDFQAAAIHLHSDQPTPNFDDFEIIFRGSTNDLSGIPSQSVALIRQRDPWPAPDGKSARIYVMADLHREC